MRKGPLRYLDWLAGVALLLIGGAAAVNYAVDPYGLRGGAGSHPRIRETERLHKAHAVPRAHADTLILGNSRAIVGLDPQHPALPQPAYNLGLSASNIYECLRYLQHAAALHPPKLVLFAIDEGMFDAKAEVETDFSETRLAVDAAGRAQPHWARADFTATVLSASALVDSARTLLRRGPRVSYAHGLRDEALMQPYLQPANILVENQRWKMHTKDFQLTRADGRAPQLDAFRATLRLCRERGIGLRVFTHPVHAELLDVLRARPGEYEDWMTRVVAAIHEENPAAEFWDFCGYNEITCEPFPARTESVSRMRHYWEISHYRKNVGDLMLKRLFAQPGGPDGFGVRVTPETLAADLARLNDERAAAAQTYAHLAR